MTTPMEDMHNQNVCENNTEGDDGQRSETETVPLDSAPLDALQFDDQHPLGARPFQSVLETLEKLERDDPKLAFQAARLIGLFRRLWESCVSKHVDTQGLENKTQALRVDNAQLRQEGHLLKNHEEDQVGRLASFQEGMEHARDQMLDALRNWNMYISDDVKRASQEVPMNE